MLQLRVYGDPPRMTAVAQRPEDIALVRLDTIAADPGTGVASALIWADLLG